MNILAINGSPRHGWNTERMLRAALEGAASLGAETELVQLAARSARGCLSCFSCKKNDCDDHKCVLTDELSPVLADAREADAIIFGSPIYFFGITPVLKAFLERFLFPIYTYDPADMTFCRKKVRTAFIYTMNMTEEYAADKMSMINPIERLMEPLLGVKTEVLAAYDTLQYDDYSRYMHAAFDPEAKRRRHEEQFPKDLEAARELGKRLARK